MRQQRAGSFDYAVTNLGLNMNRREILKSALFLGGALLLFPEEGSAQSQSPPTGGVFNPPSPQLTPFATELPRMPKKVALSGVDVLRLPECGGVLPNGTVYPQITGNDANTTYSKSNSKPNERIVALHQRNSGNTIQFPPKKFYTLNVRQARHVFHPDAPYNKGSIVWGYDGIYPGPTFLSRYGEPILIRVFNELFDDLAASGFTRGVPTPGGFGDPRITTHLHNGHTGSESDGNPADIYPPVPPNAGEPPYPASILGIRFRDHHYPMFRAGLDPRKDAGSPSPNKNDGDITESISTLWYHDHSMEHTAENVYKGLVGVHLLFDELDSGDENDANPMALRLPGGDFDIPLLFQDKRFDSSGQLVLDPIKKNHNGFLGDRFAVNGAIQPRLAVYRRKYRFRFVNAGPSRFYQFFLNRNNTDQPFKQIGNDESLLECPVEVTSVLLAVAERADVIIDFSQYKCGDQLFLENRLKMQTDGTGPAFAVDTNGNFKNFTVVPAGQGDKILRFDVAGDLPDPSRIPDKLRANPSLPSWTSRSPDELKKLKNHKTFQLDQNSDTTQWIINGEPFDPTTSFLVPQNPLPGDESDPPPLAGDGGNQRADGEVWTIQNSAGATWSHPIHIHMEEFRILWRTPINGVPMKPPPHERSKKDVIRIDPQEEVQIFLRFRDFTGKYPIHCHNVLHEDDAMMLRFDVTSNS